MFGKAAALVLATSVLATAAGASTVIDVTVYGKNQVSDFQTDFGAAIGAGTFVGEDFENLGPGGSGSIEGEVASPFETNVGSFSVLQGGVGSGGTVKNLPGNTGTNLALRDGSVYGRTNVWPEDGNWFLDSNDTFGFTWEVDKTDVGGSFDKLMFALIDGSDTGAFLRIETGDGAVFEQRNTGAAKLGNGNVAYVVVDFGQVVSSASITVGNFTSNADDASLRINDGVGIDGAMVNVVPLPASLAFLLAGMGALGVARSRKS
ncbi:VPLPA-CTERM sorting domain-containing protein [Tropicimonas sp. S265A]|uniref:VPLPA-CTERM sorting domain-containing protein n=1 Tax=Tropicimonas sp. S265A TaxID=3415134 RepID=UPI003C798286